jgi:hypothetical protein
MMMMIERGCVGWNTWRYLRKSPQNTTMEMDLR